MLNPVLHVIIGSTRPGRLGPAVGEWFAELARKHGGFEVEVIDLVDVGLPLLDEPNHPRLQNYTKDHTKRWSGIVSRGDAFVMVHPEYNYGFNAALKNALDYLAVEWRHKPVSFVSYGGVSGGLRATQMLKQVVTTLGMVPVSGAVTVPFVTQFIDGEGNFAGDDLMAESATVALDELRAMTGALSSLRT